MNALVNYIENGVGRGLRKFLVFTLVLSALLGLLINMAVYRAADQRVQEFFKQVPQVEVKDGKIVTPQNAYIIIPFLDGQDGGFVLDTRGVPPEIVFENGVYVTTDKVYVKNGGQMNLASLSDVPDTVLTQAQVKTFIDRSIALIAVGLAGLMFIILWLGYGLLYLTVKLFFLIVGRTTCPYVRGRSVFVAWSSIIVLDILLMIFGYGYSLQIAFVFALVLAIIIVFKTPLHSMTMEETLGAIVRMPVTPDEAVKIDVAGKGTSKKAPIKKSVKPAPKKVVKTPVKMAKTVKKVSVKKSVKPVKKTIKKAVKK